MTETRTQPPVTLDEGEKVFCRLVDQETAEALEALPMGARIKAEVAILWDIYKERRAGATFYFSDRIEDERFIATRYYDGRAIEETYTLIDMYSKERKNYRSQTAIVEINDSGTRYTIIVANNDEITIEMTVDGEPHFLPDEEKASILDEFFHRSSNAASAHGSRSPYERQAADTEALKMMKHHRPYLFAPSASME